MIDAPVEVVVVVLVEGVVLEEVDEAMELEAAGVPLDVVEVVSSLVEEDNITEVEEVVREVSTVASLDVEVGRLAVAVLLAREEESRAVRDDSEDDADVPVLDAVDAGPV